MALLLVLTTLGSAQSASAVDNGSLGIRPSNESDFFHLSVFPGAALEATAVVSNHTDEPVTLLTYPVDAISSDAGFAMADAAAPRVAVARWVRLGANEITVPANSEFEVPFRLQVPANTPPGDYAGALIIQSPPVEGATTTVDGDTAVRMDVIQRQGVRIYLNVAGEAIAGLQHGELTSSKDEKGITFSIPVTNSGNTLLHPTAELRLSDWTGEQTTLIFPVPESLLPGATLTLRTTLSTAPMVAVGDAEAVVTSEAGVDRIDLAYSYAPWELFAILLAGGTVLIFVGWRTVRFIRRARVALAQVNPVGAPKGSRSSTTSAAQQPLTGASRASRGRHPRPRRRRTTWAGTTRTHG
jgi:hypothetical protein